MYKQNLWPLWLALIGILVLFLGPGSAIALAHGGAELTVSPTVTTPGGDITVKGEGVESGETFTITLEGLNFEATLGAVTVGDDEDFHQDFPVPADLPPGTYQVRATSVEGEVLTTELMVEAGATTTEQAAPAAPSAELMQLERSLSTGQLALIIAGLVVIAAVGLWLVYARK